MDWSTFLNQQGQALIGAKVQAATTPPVSTDPMTGKQYQDGQPAAEGVAGISPVLLIGGGLLVAGLLFVLLRK
jgi:hypothetical protein